MSPQHAGVTGKVENCVTWVFSALITACGQPWTDFDIYMPSAGRGTAAPPEGRHPGRPGVRDEARPGHRAAQAAGGGRDAALWAAADEVYGRSGELRDACRALGLAYVVIIPCDYQVTLAKGKAIRADQAIAGEVRAAVLRQRDQRPPLQRLGAFPPPARGSSC